MERKTLKQVLDEKKAQEQSKATAVKEDKATESKESDWDTILLLSIMLSIFSIDSPRIKMLEMEIAELKGKMSILEKLV